MPRRLLQQLGTVAFLTCILPVPASAATSGRVRVILVGDSTMATRNGYGDALCGLFKNDVTCLNLAMNGRSSGSFRAEGRWDQVMRLLRDDAGRRSYVLIQFGHNDQPGKPGRSTDLVREFPANMARYVDEVTGAGAIPVLVTPLTRRIFRDGVPQNDLRPWAEATRRVANEKKIPLLDLNADSHAAVAAMGSTEADTLAEVPPPGKSGAAVAAEPVDNATVETIVGTPPKFDYTHVGAKGADFFSRIVAKELTQAVPDLARHLKSNITQ